MFNDSNSYKNEKIDRSMVLYFFTSALDVASINWKNQEFIPIAESFSHAVTRLSHTQFLDNDVVDSVLRNEEPEVTPYVDQVINNVKTQLTQQKYNQTKYSMLNYA